MRSHSWEGLRQRCLDPQCRHPARPGTDGTDSENEKEDAGELCEVNEDTDDDGTARSSLDMAVLLDEGRYVKNLWPFARPIAQSVKPNHAPSFTPRPRSILGRLRASSRRIRLRPARLQRKSSCQPVRSSRDHETT